MAGNVVLLLIIFFAQFSSRPRESLHGPISLILLLLGLTSIAALMSGIAPRLLFWATLVMNGAMAAVLVLGFYFSASANRIMVVLIVPFLLTVVAIGWMGKERRAASSQQT